MRSRGWSKTAAGLAGTLISVSLFLLAAASLWLLAGKLLWKEALPSVWGYMPVYVLSGSMEPAISAGDMILIRSQREYQPGDVVTYETEGEYVTHRIIAASVGGFTTRGDANNTADEEPVKADQIVGKVAVTVPGVGRAAMFLRTGRGRICLAAVFLLALAGSGRAGWRKKRGEEDEI